MTKPKKSWKRTRKLIDASLEAESLHKWDGYIPDETLEILQEEFDRRKARRERLQLTSEITNDTENFARKILKKINEGEQFEIECFVTDEILHNAKKFTLQQKTADGRLKSINCFLNLHVMASSDPLALSYIIYDTLIDCARQLKEIP